MYLDGSGTDQDLAEGIKWTRWAARRGDASAQYNLGKAYLEGVGVPRSRRQAKNWLLKASTQGHRMASEALAELGPVDTSAEVFPTER
jgi:TPR repeat protein